MLLQLVWLVAVLLQLIWLVAVLLQLVWLVSVLLLSLLQCFDSFLFCCIALTADVWL